MFKDPEWVAERMAEVHARCGAAGRDPDTLRFSVYTLDEDFTDPGPERIERIAAFARIGLDRIICFPTKYDPSVEAQTAFAEDCRAAGITLDGP